MITAQLTALKLLLAMLSSSLHRWIDDPKDRSHSKKIDPFSVHINAEIR